MKNKNKRVCTYSDLQKGMLLEKLDSLSREYAEDDCDCERGYQRCLRDIKEIIKCLDTDI